MKNCQKLQYRGHSLSHWQFLELLGSRRTESQKDTPKITNVRGNGGRLFQYASMFSGLGQRWRMFAFLQSRGGFVGPFFQGRRGRKDEFGKCTCSRAEWSSRFPVTANNVLPTFGVFHRRPERCPDLSSFPCLFWNSLLVSFARNSLLPWGHKAH